MSKKSRSSIFKNKIFAQTATINIAITITIFVLTIISISGENYIWRKYNISVGSVSNERLIADRDVINPIATEEKQKKVAESARVEAEATKKFNTLPNVAIDANETIQSFFNTIRTAKKNREEQIKQSSMQAETESTISESQNRTQNGMDISIDDSNLQNKKNNLPTETSYSYNFPVDLDSKQLDILIAIDSDEIDRLENSLLNIVANAFGLGIEEATLVESLSNVEIQIDKLGLNDTLKSVYYSLAELVIKPNRIVDQEYIQNFIDDKIAATEPVKVLKGEKIVDKNEIITEEKYAILDALGYTQKEELTAETILPIVGLAILIALIQAFVYDYIKTNNKKLWSDIKEKTMLFTMYCIVIIIMTIMSKLPYVIIPVSLFGMLVSMLIDLPLGILLNVVISIVGMIMNDGNINFLLYFVISGTFACILTKYTYERNNTIRAAGAISIINAIVIFGIGFMFEKSYSEHLLYTALLGILNGFITIIAVIGSLPFWEVAFDAITPLKLLELTNPNQPVLKRLIIEAPGTYHHSIIVANLAEMAAMDIGANDALAKAGAYYHDIGKLKYPNYFSENQVGENPHDYLLPLDSAKIIVEHVQAGQAFADEEGLPKVIKDMISQHHGNTLVKFFYYKAKKEFPDEPIKEEYYRYPGPIPQFKEAAILMLADTVEAAVRSMFSQGKTIDEINGIVGNLIKDKLDDGQLRDSGLTIKDLDTIQNSFIKVFKGMYHGRVAYPKEAMKSRKLEDK